MEQAARIQIIKGFYKAYAEADRAFVESAISNDFTFSSPPDPLLTYETYFERCWPGAGRGQQFEFKRIAGHEDEIIVTYELSLPDAKTGRNTEIFSFEGRKIKRVEVYFGWTVD